MILFAYGFGVLVGILTGVLGMLWLIDWGKGRWRGWTI